MTLTAIIAAHAIALANFVYQAEPEGQDVWQQFETIERPFTGDCDTFAFTVRHALGDKGDVMYAVMPDKQAHAILDIDGVTVDCVYGVSTRAELGAKGVIFVMPLDPSKIVKEKN